MPTIKKKQNGCANYARASHFDNIRIINEILYMISVYLPILNSGKYFNNSSFTNIVFVKLNEYYKIIHHPRHDMRPETDEEHRVVQSFIHTLSLTQSVVNEMMKTN